MTEPRTSGKFHILNRLIRTFIFILILNRLIRFFLFGLSTFSMEPQSWSFCPNHRRKVHFSYFITHHQKQKKNLRVLSTPPKPPHPLNFKRKILFPYENGIKWHWVLFVWGAGSKLCDRPPRPNIPISAPQISHRQLFHRQIIKDFPP